MNQQTDLSKITDVKELKSLAFDQMAIRDNAIQNLNMIYQRLQEVDKPSDEPEKIEDTNPQE
jgi:hypothetical protein